jgi:protection-of-telomeres protein 1
LDKSTDEDGTGLTINIFRPKEFMPQPNAGDIVHLYRAKVYNFQGELCLITHFTTEINVFTAAEIPRPPRSAEVAMKRTRPKGRDPTPKELEYVSWLYHTTEKTAIPSAADFEVQVEQSRNTKDKFSTLEGVRDGRFFDIVTQVIKEPYDQMDKVTLWVSDYTENDGFFKFSWDGSDISNRDGDPFGYHPVRNNASRGWPGPFGKRSIQLTCFEPHASYIRAEVKAGDWVKLRNVQIKYGHNNNNLEGFLREDRVFASKLQVDLIDTSNPDSIDGRLKEAIRRKRDYEKTAKQQKQTYAANEGAKRKADQMEDSKPNSKQKRKAKRAAVLKKAEEQETKKSALIGLNELIKCESKDKPVFPLSTILEPIAYATTVDGQQVELKLPFTDAKYLANVRIVDFRPRKLENFAIWRKHTEYDMLSDYSGGSDSESDDERGTLDAFVGDKTWEWRFALQLEEAGLRPGKKGEPERLWAMVENIEAQQLVNVDACE